MTLFGNEILRFRYQSVELAGLDVEEYRKGVGPVGASLGALSRKEYRKVQVVELTWLDKAELKGAQKALLRLLEAKFGALDEQTRERVRVLSPAALDACLERVLTASSLDDMELDVR